MQRWLELSRRIDGMNRRIGQAASWLTLGMVLLGAYNASARYLGRFIQVDLSSNAYIELQWYMFSLVFLLAAAATLRRNAHVRVDVLYGRLEERSRIWIDLLGTTLFLLPFSALTLWLSWPSVSNSWKVLEGSADPGGLPRYPLKAVILIAFALLFLQGLSELIKQVAFLRGCRDSSPEETGAPQEGL